MPLGLRQRARMLERQQGVLREEADKIILQIWNVVERHYERRLPYDRLRSCKNYGLVFYYRPNEKRITPETDKAIEKAAASQMKLELL